MIFEIASILIFLRWTFYRLEPSHAIAFTLLWMAFQFFVFQEIRAIDIFSIGVLNIYVATFFALSPMRSDEISGYQVAKLTKWVTIVFLLPVYWAVFFKTAQFLWLSAVGVFLMALLEPLKLLVVPRLSDFIPVLKGVLVLGLAAFFGAAVMPAPPLSQEAIDYRMTSIVMGVVYVLGLALFPFVWKTVWGFRLLIMFAVSAPAGLMWSMPFALLAIAIGSIELVSKFCRPRAALVHSR